MLSFSPRVQSYLHTCEYQKNLSKMTVKAYRTDLRQFISFLADDMPSKDIIKKYIDTLHLQYKPKSVKRKIASLKAFFNYLAEEELWDENPFSRLRISYKEPVILPKTVPMETLQKLLSAMYHALNDGGLTSYKRRAIVLDICVLELLFATGMRVSELCNLRAEDIDLTSQIVRIYGKGARERIMQIENVNVLAMLKEYRAQNQAAITACGFFFINRLGKRLSEQSVRNILCVWTRQAKITQHITPHMIRHTFATLLLEEDVDIRYIQRMLGHSSLITTQIYTHIAAAKQKQILATKHPRNRMVV